MLDIIKYKGNTFSVKPIDNESYLFDTMINSGMSPTEEQDFIEKSKPFAPILNWLRETFNDDDFYVQITPKIVFGYNYSDHDHYYVLETYDITFFSKEDALLFKLTWG